MKDVVASIETNKIKKIYAHCLSSEGYLFVILRCNSIDDNMPIFISLTVISRLL